MSARLQRREWVYTAATRGKESVAIYGAPGNLHAALRSSCRTERLTRLSSRLGSALRKRVRDDE